MQEIIINDKRGANKEKVVRPEHALGLDKSGGIKEDSVLSENSVIPFTGKKTWADVGYYAIAMQTEHGTMFIGRATGERSDGELFVGDYLIPPVWAEDLVWQVLAKKRLDTFLDCQCSEGKTCATHKLYFANWSQGDQQRIQAIMSAPLPRSIEGVIRKEQEAAKTRIIAPGGPIR